MEKQPRCPLQSKDLNANGKSASSCAFTLKADLATRLTEAWRLV